MNELMGNLLIKQEHLIYLWKTLLKLINSFIKTFLQQLNQHND